MKGFINRTNLQTENFTSNYLKTIYNLGNLRLEILFGKL